MSVVRFSRVLAALALVGVVMLGIAWQVTASPGAPKSHRVEVSKVSGTARGLHRQLAPSVRAVPGNCAVAGSAGSCSIQPCVLDIQQQAGNGGPVPDQVPIAGDCKGYKASP